MKKLITIITTNFLLFAMAAQAQIAPSKLKITGVIKVILSQVGNELTVTSKPEHDDDEANSFEAKVKNGMLVIDTKPVHGLTSYTLSKTNLTEIEVGGTVSLHLKNALSFNNIKFLINGVIEGPINVTANQVSIESRGVSTLYFEGRTNNLFINATGVSDICAKNLIATTATVNSKNIGSIWVNVTQTLVTNAEDISHVYYKSYKWDATPNQRLPLLQATTKSLSFVKVWKDNNNYNCEAGEESKGNNNPNDNDPIKHSKDEPIDQPKNKQKGRIIKVPGVKIETPKENEPPHNSKGVKVEAPGVKIDTSDDDDDKPVSKGKGVKVEAPGVKIEASDDDDKPTNNGKGVVVEAPGVKIDVPNSNQPTTEPKQSTTMPPPPPTETKQKGRIIKRKG